MHFICIEALYVSEVYLTPSLREKEERKSLLHSSSVKWGMALAALVAIIWIGRGPIFENTVKIGTDTQDYIWYCQNETQWKSDDYFKV